MVAPGGSLDDLRLGVREWCATHVPKDWREQQRGVSHAELVGFLRWWADELRDAGLLAPHWPKEWGGGFSIPEQVVIAEELARGDVRPATRCTTSGSSTSRRRSSTAPTPSSASGTCPGIWNGEMWCQGYSEPNAGSDLASLQTRAVRDGDNYVVNGQKVWTSWAKDADWCMLLVRTDPDAPKHKGISCLSSTCTRPASRCGRSSRRGAPPTSTRSSSTT